MNEIMSRVRPEEWERRIIFMPSEAVMYAKILHFNLYRQERLWLESL